MVFLPLLFPLVVATVVTGYAWMEAQHAGTRRPLLGYFGRAVASMAFIQVMFGALTALWVGFELLRATAILSAPPFVLGLLLHFASVGMSRLRGEHK
jgi:hypothetical protein